MLSREHSKCLPAFADQSPTDEDAFEFFEGDILRRGRRQQSHLLSVIGRVKLYSCNNPKSQSVGGGMNVNRNLLSRKSLVGNGAVRSEEFHKAQLVFSGVCVFSLSLTPLPLSPPGAIVTPLKS